MSMSLKLLAVGQSLAGIRSEKSPYALREENRLPTFQSAPRFKHAERAMIQADWLQAPNRPSPAPEVALDRPVERQMPVSSAPVQSVAPKRRWYSFLKLKWFQTSKPKIDLVQTELTLEKVQPIRNDLADSDLRLVLKRKKSTEQDHSRLRAGWSELTARLFELGQR
jgi:hypothetical protein